MPVRYELRYDAYTIMGTSTPHGTDGISSLIRVDAAAPLYLFLQARDIFATVEIEGNLEIFTLNHSTLIIENFFTAAAGSRIYLQDDDDIHSYTEYKIGETIQNSQGHEPQIEAANMPYPAQTINDLLQFAKKSLPDATAARHLAEQELFKELFKKDNFGSGKYSISYDPESRVYTASRTDLDFLTVARSLLDEAQANLDDSNDLAPEIAFRMLEEIIESMSRHPVANMLFWADGKISHSSYLLDNKGEWFSANGSASAINHMQASTRHDSNFTECNDSVPLFSALEILNARENKINALVEFEKFHGNAGEIVFNLGNAAFEAMKADALSHDQKSFIAEVHAKMHPAQILEKINNLFPDAGTTMRTYGTQFQEQLDILKAHATLKSEETFAKEAVTRVEEHTVVNLSRLEIVTNAHQRIVKEMEICAQHCKSVVQICGVLDQLGEIERNFLRGNDHEDVPLPAPALWQAAREMGVASSSEDGAQDPAALTGLIEAPDSALAPHY